MKETLFILIVFPSLCISQNKVYNINTEKSKIDFKIAHMGVLTVNGTFHDFSGKLTLNKNNIKKIESKIVVKSIDTKDKTRDKSLIDEAYLNDKKYPYIYFISNRVKTIRNSNTVTGILRIKEIEKEIIILFEKKRTNNESEIHLKGSTKIKRQDFNLNFGALNALVGDYITINLNIIYNSL